VLRCSGRGSLAAAQTPQGVRRGILREAYRRFPPEGPQEWTDEAALLEVYVEGLWAFLDSADQLDLTLDFDGKAVQVRSWLSTLADSPMASVGGDQHFELGKAAAWIDPNDSISMVMACDAADMLKKFGPALDMILDAYPAELGAELERLMKAYEPVLGLLGNHVAASGRIGGGGMRVASGSRRNGPPGCSAKRSAPCRASSSTISR